MNTAMRCSVIPEDEEDRDEETKVISKRIRRRSDVIDSIGERDDDILPPGLSTPRAAEIDNEVFFESPEQNDMGTPELGSVFRPEWLGERKVSDLLDAGLFQEEISGSQQSGHSTTTRINKDAETYNMDHKKRGKCVVFNHEVFDTGFEPREGSMIDAKRIDRTFSNLGFEVEILDNLEHEKVFKKINELSDEDHSDSDCLVIFMLTHGLASDMIFAKDVAYNAERIWKPFTAEKCPTLAGKPKLFFFQFCRGKTLDAGVEVKSKSEALRTEVDAATTSYKLPTHADFLIANSTPPDHCSWRNPEIGTWFIQSLCDTIDEYHESTDLQKMLTICSRKVATEFASYNDLNPAKHEQKQVPSITSMLIRDIYFTPK